MCQEAIILKSYHHPTEHFIMIAFVSSTKYENGLYLIKILISLIRAGLKKKTV